MSRGYLSELLAYVQVLFGTRAAEIPSQDRVHFANVAALCFVQQVLAKRRAPERDAVAQAFRSVPCAVPFEVGQRGRTCFILTVG